MWGFFDRPILGVAMMRLTGEMAFVVFAGMMAGFLAVLMFTKARRVRRRDG